MFARRAIAKAIFETLESRKLMSISPAPIQAIEFAPSVVFTASTHALNVYGNSSRQSFLVTNSAGRLSVSNLGTTLWTGATSEVWRVSVVAGAGDDTVQADTVAVPMILDGGAGNDTLIGGSSHDQLIGGAGNDQLNGFAGNDSLLGGDGNDSLSGGAGNDFLDGGLGADFLSGGADFDTLSYFTRTTSVDVRLDGIANDGSYGELDNVQADINRIDGGSGSDTFHARYDGVGAVSFYGNAGHDRLYGGRGNDHLDGGPDSDFVYGDEGNDSLFGQSGNDEIYGLDGNDLAWGGSGDDVIRGYAGSDRLYGEDGQDLLYAGAGTADGNDQLYGGNDNDILVAIGGGQFDSIFGEAGFDSYWLDSELTETLPDVTTNEIAGRNVHRVASFYSYTVNGVQQAAPRRELNAPSIINPTFIVTHTRNDGTTYQSGTRYDSGFADVRPLFGPNGPTVNGIHQGDLNDSYFLATLGAIVRTNSHKIYQSVVDLGDGTYAVRFNRNGVDHFVRVNGDLASDTYEDPTYAGFGEYGATWVAIMEKAWAYFRTNAGSYQSIAGGTSAEVFAALGNSPTTYSAALSSSTLMNYIQRELNSGKAMTFTTTSTAARIPAGSGIATNRVYTVCRVNLDANGNIVSLTLRDNTERGTNDITWTPAQAIAVFHNVCSASVAM